MVSETHFHHANHDDAEPPTIFTSTHLKSTASHAESTTTSFHENISRVSESVPLPSSNKVNDALDLVNVTTSSSSSSNGTASQWLDEANRTSTWWDNKERTTSSRWDQGDITTSSWLHAVHDATSSWFDEVNHSVSQTIPRSNGTALSLIKEAHAHDDLVSPFDAINVTFQRESNVIRDGTSSTYGPTDDVIWGLLGVFGTTLTAIGLFLNVICLVTWIKHGVKPATIVYFKALACADIFMLISLQMLFHFPALLSAESGFDDYYALIWVTLYPFEQVNTHFVGDRWLISPFVGL